jgi:hypothetical protein
MTTGTRVIKCKACANVLATVTDSGLAPALSAAESSECETCQQFHPLYDAMEAADAEYSSFQDRRDNYRPKQDALLKVKNTRMVLNNWLMSIESDPEHGRTREVDEPQTLKRARSRSLPLAQDGPTHPTTTSFRKLRDSDAVPLRKRFRFAEQVEFREDYRPSQHYARGDQAYVRGRYAALENGEHLDTSGSAKTFLTFTGMKKVGKEWIDVWTDDEEDKGSKGKKRAVDTSATPVADVEVANVCSAVRENAVPLDAVPLDARARRLARRSGNAQKNTTGESRTQGTSDAKSHILGEVVPTESGAVAARSTVTAEYAEVGRSTKGSMDTSAQKDVTPHHPLVIESSKLKEEASSSLDVPEDTSLGGGTIAGSEAEIACVELPKTAEETGQHRHELAVRMPISDSRRVDQQELLMIAGLGENTLRIAEKERIEECADISTKKTASLVAPHDQPHFEEYSFPASIQNRGIGPINDKPP